MSALDFDAKLTGSEAARHLGVSRQLVNKWRVLGHLTPDECGRYRLGDLLQVERDMRRSPQSRRKLVAA